MHHREPRSNAYDEQNAAYPPGHIASHGVDYMANTYTSYDNSGQYYAAPSNGLGNVSDGKYEKYTSTIFTDNASFQLPIPQVHIFAA